MATVRATVNYVRNLAPDGTTLRTLTGATRVVMLGRGKKRFGEAATDDLEPLKNAKPARYPHADNTSRSAAARSLSQRSPSSAASRRCATTRRATAGTPTTAGAGFGT